MIEESRKKGLGRGLSALLGEMPATDNRTAGAGEQPRGQLTAPVDLVHPNPDQPRKNFEKDELEDLAASIAEKGILQPLIVRPDPNHPGAYQIVAGERRWRAAQIAQLHEVPILVKDLTDSEVMELGLIENVQRADLNAVEEAEGYALLIEKYAHTQEALARIVGKSRSYIANSLRLRSLPGDVLGYVRSGKLSAGHARALITTPNPSALARQAIEKGLSVREVERLTKSASNSKPGAPRRSVKDPDTLALEADLRAALGLPVTIAQRRESEAGELKIAYASLDELDGLCQLLSQPR